MAYFLMALVTIVVGCIAGLIHTGCEIGRHFKEARTERPLGEKVAMLQHNDSSDRLLQEVAVLLNDKGFSGYVPQVRRTIAAETGKNVYER